MDQPLLERVSQADKVVDTHVGEPEFAAIRRLPVVGIGASAGGLEAIEELFRHMPSDTGMTFVMVQHLDPNHKSILSELIARFTTMLVSEATSGKVIQPNHIYVIPPNRDLDLLNGTLQLIAPVGPRHLRLSIDHFFRSLALDQGPNAVCIVLSGAGSDGSLGLRAIKGEGGVALVQIPETAAYDSMPRSALATGLADAVLAPREIGPWLSAYARHFPPPGSAEAALRELESGPEADKLFTLVRNHTGYDFSLYKEGTIGRRIERRMAVNRVNSLADYIPMLQQNPAEIDRLWKDFLISVTQFFRNQKAMEALDEKALQALVSNRLAGQPIRIWVPGCSTGEEAYSLAMLVQERLERLGLPLNLQVFATDIDQDALQIARMAVYPQSVAADVPAHYLRRHFLRHPQGFQMAKALRGSIVFARHDITRDPPFSRMDLVSCRNLLIYLRPPLQERVLDTLTYALKPQGVLFLGISESIGKFSHLYETLDRRARIFRRTGLSVPGIRSSQWVPRRLLNERGEDIVPSRDPGESELKYLTESALLKEHTPVCVIVDERYQVLYVHGHAGRYLEPAVGRASMYILKMARDGLRNDLAGALREVASSGNLCRIESLRVKSDESERLVNLTVRQFPGEHPKVGAFMVLFEDAGPLPQQTNEQTRDPVDLLHGADRLVWLEKELAVNRESLQNANEELETSNEELQSTVEELQSSNEELMTSQEELSSINEELLTVNVELEDKIRQLEATSDDLENLLQCTELGTIFLDVDLRVRRFTPAATKVINLLEADIGRPVEHIVHKLEYTALIADAEQVLDTLQRKTVEVRGTDGVWYSLRITAYRTGNNAVGGVVLTFVDRTDYMLAEQRFHQLLESVPDAMILSNNIGEIVQVNRHAERLFGYEPGNMIGLPLDSLLPERFRERHQENRLQFYRKPLARPMGRPGLQLFALRADGNEFPADIAIGPIPGYYDQMYVATVRDIGTRRCQEFSLARANKMFYVFANWTQAHYLSSDKMGRSLELLCRNLVSVEGCSRCWICLDDTAPGMGLTLIAHGGFASTESTLPEPDWIDPGYGLTPLVIRRLVDKGVTDKLRQAAFGWGCNSILSIPMMAADRRVGVLVVCSMASDAFSVDEVSLWQTLSSSLAATLAMLPHSSLASKGS
ncbi:MAG: PAS domain-containing protein [Candidatus Accumulibacter sp.]|uniref:protein-glutamate O-methyltransferase n=1 Tax=Candidatus Accumulibacter phosphatis TaxID=327160 RepID=A0A5S4EH85_9PROT|nr:MULTISPECIES: chemotaxis protein CheB [Candidatus Accumulibacter]HNN42899.1 chemotaxis protein CheB [Nitrospira sp.]MBN8520200.1 PAS domain-containing protein [Accumulibacter sp.]MBO3712950.1 PAS domain-containing protein [Accumulibacter sp.]TMQ74599.1 Chemotaxis protein methyltransferase CheR [Candidatus Accumulibacter phosphatis]HNO34991.1 chemotaxis protein CheB [Nitrospira sp.]